MIVFIDTNVFLDVLLNRDKLADSSEKVLDICSSNGYKIYTSSISFANITYFISKFRSAEARDLLLHLLNSINIIDSSAKDFEKALQSDFRDIEDAYQYYTAINIRSLKYFITRNVKHYKDTTLSITTPEEFIKKRN